MLHFFSETFTEEANIKFSNWEQDKCDIQNKTEQLSIRSDENTDGLIKNAIETNSEVKVVKESIENREEDIKC